MRRQIIAAVLIGLSVVVPAGCGGDDDKSAFCELEGKGDIDLAAPDGAKKAVEAMDEALTDAPEEVKADLQKVRDLLNEVAGLPVEQQQAALGGRLQELNDAAQRVADFGEANC